MNYIVTSEGQHEVTGKMPACGDFIMIGEDKYIITDIVHKYHWSHEKPTMLLSQDQHAVAIPVDYDIL